VTKHDHAPHKKRISEWTNPGLIGIALVLSLIGLPMVLWLMTYHSDAAVTMFVITWLSLTFFVLLMARTSVSDRGYYIDGKVIDKTKREIKQQREFVRKEILKNEISALRLMQRVPVLDVWRLDETLAQRHPYFKLADSQIMDASQREYLIHIQLGETGQSDLERRAFCDSLWSDLVTYLRLVTKDQYLSVLRQFFDVIVVQIDSVREDDRHIDVPYPVLSLMAQAPAFWELAAVQVLDRKRLQEVSEIRFEDGNEIQPHRSIELPSSRGLK
jgi:hypothetical protein